MPNTPVLAAATGLPEAITGHSVAGLLVAYQTWLHFEYRAVCWELANKDSAEFDQIKRSIFTAHPAARFHHFNDAVKDRAEYVFRAIGCDWRDVHLEQRACAAFPHLTEGLPSGIKGGAPSAATDCEATVDPIFAAIEHHKPFFDAYGDAAARTDAVAAKKAGRTVTQVDKDLLEKAMDLEERAWQDLLACVPQTVPGVLAMIKYIQPIVIDYVDQDALLESIMKSPALLAA